ncbi:MAG TPA: aminotransferase class I/II-fold pyridoxal phosphate-dependent enzyme [Clostridiales bacterium]|nr:aminotransferase class I/II-fold pyridoxal phosphate-dependent enzyme [Clostridiales bacterium]
MTAKAKRLDFFEEGIFIKINKKVVEMVAAGRKIYNLSVGTPDFPPQEHVMAALAQSALKPASYKYALRDFPDVLEAVANYYKKRFGVTLNHAEIMAVHGTQEGMGHLGMALCNPGDVVLLPDPGYPVFEAGAHLGGGEIVHYPLLRENGFLPVLADIPPAVYERTKYIVVSYPTNPTGAVAPKSFYEELIEYAKKYDFYIINDNAYPDIIFTEDPGYSFLSLPDAKEVGAEFFSLSKTFDLCGARISFFIGNRELVEALSLLRSQLDFGVFYPVQRAAVAALSGPLDFVETQRMAYKKRRDALCGGLCQIGWPVENSMGTMFVFAKIPPQYDSSEVFAGLLLEKTGVVCTPGIAFGPCGEGYVRFALTQPAEILEEVTVLIGDSGLI